MRLDAQMLKNVVNVNQWEHANDVYIQEGQANDFYFQVMDRNKELAQDCYMRYISQATVTTMTVTFSSIDDAKIITANAVQPFSDDKSIWKVSLTSSQTPNSGSIQIKLTEDGVDKFFNARGVIQVNLLNNGGC